MGNSQAQTEGRMPQHAAAVGNQGGAEHATVAVPPPASLSSSFGRGTSIVVAMRVLFVRCIDTCDSFEVPVVISQIFSILFCPTASHLSSLCDYCHAI